MANLSSFTDYHCLYSGNCSIPQILLGSILLAYAMCVSMYWALKSNTPWPFWDKQFEPQSHLDLAASLYYLKVSNRIAIFLYWLSIWTRTRPAPVRYMSVCMKTDFESSGSQRQLTWKYLLMLGNREYICKSEISFGFYSSQI